MTEANPEANKEKRTPAACPECGYSGAFGGLGTFERSFTRRRSEEPAERVRQGWVEFNCPNCTGQFAILDIETTEEGED